MRWGYVSGTVATNWPIVNAQMIREWIWSIGGLYWQGKTEGLAKKRISVPLHPPQNLLWNMYRWLNYMKYILYVFSSWLLYVTCALKMWIVRMKACHSCLTMVCSGKPFSRWWPAGSEFWGRSCGQRSGHALPHPFWSSSGHRACKNSRGSHQGDWWYDAGTTRTHAT